MKFTINCMRVHIPQGTTLWYPAFTGAASNHAAPPRPSSDGDTLNISRRVLSNRAEPTPFLPSQETLLVVKTKLFLTILMLGTLPPKGT